MLRRMPPSSQPSKAVAPPAIRILGAPRREPPAPARQRAGRAWYDDGVAGPQQHAGVGVAPLPRVAAYATDDALVAALRVGDARARLTLVDRFGPYIERLVAGALGVDADL